MVDSPTMQSEREHRFHQFAMAMAKALFAERVPLRREQTPEDIGMAVAFLASDDASYFVGKHEVKFGADWRSTPVDTQQIWPASHLIATWDMYPNMFVQVAREWKAGGKLKDRSAWVEACRARKSSIHCR